MIQHLLELRKLALQILIGFGLLFLLFFYYSDSLFLMLAKPLLLSLPPHSSLIATQVTTPVFTPIKLATNAALVFSTPLALIQLWRFVSPGLYKNERHLLAQTLCISLLLFLTGILFCFYLVLPFMFQIFAHSLPQNVHFMPDMAYALDFVCWMLLLFGGCFQVPLICVIIVHLQLIDLQTLKDIRPYVIVGAFIIGMLLTPPDVFSQIMLAVPLCLLYEFGILLSARFKLFTH